MVEKTVFLSCDIEGACGVAHWNETEKGHPDYPGFQQQMTLEAAAACEGAAAAGADRVLVKDAHDSARNLIPRLLPRLAVLNRDWSGGLCSMMHGVDTPGIRAAMMTGYHSAAGCGGNPLAHTMNRQNEEVLLNGERMSEFQMNALTAGFYGVPVVFLSGDKQLCDWAAGWIPGLITVAVSEGCGGSSTSIHPDLAVERIREGVQKALSGDVSACTVPMPARFTMQIRFRDHRRAYSGAFYPGAHGVGEKTVEYTADNWLDMLRFVHFVL